MNRRIENELDILDVAHCLFDRISRGVYVPRFRATDGDLSARTSPICVVAYLDSDGLASRYTVEDGLRCGR